MGMTDAVLAVVGGRMVLTKVSSPMSSGVRYPINGQQLIMQLDSLTSSLMDMSVTTDEGNMETEQTQQQHIEAQQQILKSQQQQQQRPVSSTNNQCHQKCILWEY